MPQEKTSKPTEPTSPELLLVNNLIKTATDDSFFGSGFNPTKFANIAELRGLNSKEYWTQITLDAVMIPYRRCLDSDSEGAKTDEALQYLSGKIGVDINVLRRNLYCIPKPLASSSEEPFDESQMNPALPTVLKVSGLSSETWSKLPASLKKSLHSAVKSGNLDMVRDIALEIGKGALSFAEIAAMFA